ncbi:Wzz/FepE/Etk N-terminal domain-containing protein [Paenibacillus sp. CC-CFT747]|nr:Wzz/FepE/Etk N-terminal domain-containing protein [Paenibacillus sp. CC-CFT747]
MQDEISLREIVEVFWGGKKVILILIAACLLLATIVVSFTAPIYEATTTVLINTTNEKQNNLDLTAFSKQMESNYEINKVIESSKLDPNNYNLNKVRSMIEVDASKDSNLIKITAKGNNSAEIVTISNVFAFELGSIVEVASRLATISDLKKSLIVTENEIKLNQSQLENAHTLLQATPEKIKTQRVLADDPYLQSLVRDQGTQSNKNLSSLELNLEELNPAYTDIKKKYSEISIELSKNQSKKQTLEQEIVNNQGIITDLQKPLNVEELKKTNYNLSENRFNAMLLIPAVDSGEPVGPNKLLYYLVAIVVGLIFSTVIVFIRDYWKKSKKPVEPRVEKNLLEQ